MIVHTILYVANQNRSAKFYSAVLAQAPVLDVPGMSEFKLSEGHVLGLMPESGIKRLLGDALPDLDAGRGIPRVELYVRVEKPQEYIERALEQGATLLSPLEMRNWGERAGYVMDGDGHVLAFAETVEK